MPLSKQTSKAMIATCRQVKARPFQFFYCLGGVTGEPELLIGRRLSSEARELRKSAKKRRFVRGEVARVDGRLQFRTDTPDAAKFKKNLKRYFGPRIPDLKRAEVVGKGEAEAEDAAKAAAPEAGDAPPPAEPALPAAQIGTRLLRAQQTLRGLEGRLRRHIRACDPVAAAQLRDELAQALAATLNDDALMGA